MQNSILQKVSYFVNTVQEMKLLNKLGAACSDLGLAAPVSGCLKTAAVVLK
jgi:hypothetical protein